MIGTRTSFAALAGALLCLGLGSVADLSAADPKERPGKDTEGGKVVGILTHFEYNWTKVHGPKPDTRAAIWI